MRLTHRRDLIRDLARLVGFAGRFGLLTFALQPLCFSRFRFPLEFPLGLADGGQPIAEALQVLGQAAPVMPTELVVLGRVDVVALAEVVADLLS